jgi:hypothetical protein
VTIGIHYYKVPANGVHTHSFDLIKVTANYVHTRRMVSSWMLRRVALIRTDVSEELSASLIRVTRNGELGTT